jgi:trans-aconitate methyltransferase
MQQTWDASHYADNGRFVALMVESLVDTLDPKPGERILDLGCGDGFLTQRLAQSGATLVGIDSSPAMAAAARERGIDAHCLSGENLNFNQEFDAVFSNAAMHWMEDHDAVLEGVYRALKPGGRFVAEFGGQGNIASIRVALLAVCTRHGLTAKQIENNRFFAPAEYRALLEKHKFQLEEIKLTPRPTPLATGMVAWLETFRSSVLELLPQSERQNAMDEIVGLLRPALCDRQGNWTADYVRLRFQARRP